MHAAHTVSDACPVSGCALLPTRVCVVRGYAPCAGTRRAQLRAVLNYALCMDTRHARLAPCAGAGTRRASCAPTRRARVATRRARRAHRGGAKVKVTVSACPIGGPALSLQVRFCESCEPSARPYMIPLCGASVFGGSRVHAGPVGSVSVLGSVMFKMRGVI